MQLPHVSNSSTICGSTLRSWRGGWEWILRLPYAEPLQPGMGCVAFLPRWGDRCNDSSPDMGSHQPELTGESMLDPEKVGVWLEHHFATVTPEEFVTTVKRVSPDLTQELWGDRSVEEILSERHRPVRSSVRGRVASFGRSVLRLFS
jgi:hypothetical protein